MPQAFESCVKRGGRVGTKKLSGGRYMHFCSIDGKSYAGEVHEAKGAKLKRVIKGD